MKIDLHSHTAEHSGCCPIPAIEMVRAAKARGLDGLVISDHYYHLTDDERRRLEEAVPGIRIFRGIEINIRQHGGWGAMNEDLVIVSDVPCGHLHPTRADRVERLGDFADQAGALTVLAHPFRYHPEVVFDLARFRPDAIEVASQNVDPTQHDRVAGLARAHGMQVVACSDAHHTNEAAMFYVDLDDEVRTERELADAVRRGAFTLAAHEPTLQNRAELIEPLETIARQVIDAGGDLDDFLMGGGRFAVIFERVAAGGSALPNRRAVGLRNPVAS